MDKDTDFSFLKKSTRGLKKQSGAPSKKRRLVKALLFS